MAVWRKVADSLGLAIDAGQDPCVIYGVKGDLLVRILGHEGAFLVGVTFTGGRDQEAVRRRIQDDRSLAAAYQEHCGRGFSMDVVGVDATSATLVVTPEGESAPPCSPERIQEVLVAFCEAAGEDAPPIDLGCRVCGGDEASLQLLGNQALILCAGCRAELEHEARTEKPDESDGEGMEAPDLDPRAVLQKQQQLQAAYEKNREGYWRGLVGWVALGQAMLLFISLGALALVGLLVMLVVFVFSSGLWVFLLKCLAAAKVLILVALKMAKVAVAAGIALGCLLWALGKGLFKLVKGLLWRKPSSQLEGYRLARGELPGFFAWLDALGDKVGAPPVDALVIDASLNAAATEEPCGWRRYQRVVVLGLPVLEFFDVEEIEAIMGHELGHLRHGDVRSLWVYRTCNVCSDLWKALGRAGAEGELMRRFLQWYVPSFLVRAQVVQREHEVAADARACEVTGSAVMGRALMKTNVLARLYAQAQVDMLKSSARGSAAVPDDPVAMWREAITQLPEAKWRQACQEALEEEPHWLDTHPQLRDRLGRMGVEASAIPESEWRNLAPANPGHSLVDDWPRHRAVVVASVRSDLEKPFKKLHRLYRRVRARDAKLTQQLEACPDDVPLLVESARCKKELGAWPDAESLYGRALDLDPDHRDARRELCETYAEQEKWDQAMAEVETLLARVPPDPELQLMAARFFERGGQPARGIELYQRVLELEMPVAVRAALEGKVRTLEGRLVKVATG